MRFRSVTLALAGMAVSLGAVAQRLPVGGELTTRVIFTDNLFLTAVDRESDAILQVTPTLSGGGTGKRTSYRWYAGPSLLFYAGHPELNRTFLVLRADAAVDIVDEYLGLQVSARANPNIVDPSNAPAGFDALGNPDNFAQTGSIEIRPIVRFPLVRGDFATVQIEPGINYVFSPDTSGIADEGTFGTRSSVTVRSGTDFSRLIWSLRWYANVWNDSDTTDRRESVYGTASWRIDRTWAIEGQLGYDYGSYGTDDDDTGGVRWRIGPIWTPNDRTSVELAYGQRYYGPDWSFRALHRLKKLRVSVEYETSITDTRTQVLNDDVVQFQDPFGDTLAIPGVQAFGTVATPVGAGGTFVFERLRGTLDYRLRRGSWSLSVWQDQRDYRESDISTIDLYGQLVYSRPLTPELVGSLELDYWGRDDDSVAPVRFSQYRGVLNLTYRLGSRVSTGASWSYLTRDTDEGAGFDENRLLLTLNWTLF